LEAFATEIAAALVAEAKARLDPAAQQATLKNCFDVIKVGNEGFRKVYGAVWDLIEDSEAEGVLAYVEVGVAS
jgi:hypothetical protein